MKRRTRQTESQNRQDLELLESIKKKIIYLRVVDLQGILASQNLNRYGKKDELQRRILDVFKGSDVNLKNKVKSKIEEILSNNNNSRGPSPSTTPVPDTMYHQNVGYADATVRNPVAHVNGISGIPQYAGAIQQGGFPIHPDVKLKKLAFYDILGTLLPPSTLVPQNSSQRVQENSYMFHLTPQQATEIACNRDTRNPAKIEHVIQVQLRFCLLETTCEQEDYFPPNVQVKVNGKMCQLPNPIPTNKPGVEAKRPPRPVNITTHVKLSPTVSNVIYVQWGSDYNRGFVISCYLVRKLTSCQLLQRMKTKGIKPADYTRGLIKEKFNEDADCEIATTLLKVSLICPLGKMRMTTPCRASTCLHLQCFDASLYLQMNERKPTWNCPVCDKPALYENLVIDGYFQDVVASNKLSSDDNEIQLHKDGSWSTLLNKAELCSLDTPMKTQKIEVISDDIEVITDIPKPMIKSQLTYSSNGNENGSNGESVAAAAPPGDTVDLTMSDSDDEMPLKKTCTRTTQNSKSKTSDNLNTTIIMLDSPSPPSRSPQHTTSNNTNYQSNFGTAYNEIAGSGRHINPFAYDLSIDPFENTTRQSTNVPNNVNVVHPFSENSRR